MDTSLYLSFLLVSFGIIAVPGPNILVIVSTSVMHGKIRGLQTVAGTSCAMAIQLFIAAISTSTFVQIVEQGFSVLKWLGVAYLLFLGMSHLRQGFRTSTNGNRVSGAATFSRGFVVSISNPKTILFFSAFMPLFVTPGDAYFIQITILSVTFWLLAILLDSCYALLAARIQVYFNSNSLHRFQHGISGLMFLGASAWLAVTRRL